MLRVDGDRSNQNKEVLRKEALTRAALPPQKRKTKPIPRWTLKKDVLTKLRTEFPQPKMTIIWDGAPYHRAELVKQVASEMDIHLEPLPGYSPEFMPVEHLWQWLREELTYHTCYEREQELIDAVADFQNQINTQPLTVSDRLWVKKHLEPEEEKLRVSK